MLVTRFSLSSLSAYTRYWLPVSKSNPTIALATSRGNRRMLIYGADCLRLACGERTRTIEVGPSPIELASSGPISYISWPGLTARPLGIFRVKQI
jgi:hypothetical protein